MADGRHFLKIEESPYFSNSSTDHHGIWYEDTHWPS